MSRIRNFIRELKAAGHNPHIALLLDADLDFAQPTPQSTHKEANQ